MRVPVHPHGLALCTLMHCRQSLTHESKGAQGLEAQGSRQSYSESHAQLPSGQLAMA